jgi:hypothetical protein
VTAIWNLRENLRFLLALHLEGQRAFARRTAEPEREAQKKTDTRANAKIVQIQA